MAELTANYNLKKPFASEFYNIDDANGNMDLIDNEMKSNADGIAQNASDIADGDAALQQEIDDLSFNQLILENQTIDDGLVIGDCVRFDGTEWEKTNIPEGLYLGNSVIAISGYALLSGFSLDSGYTYFAQTDGSIGLGVTAYPVGKAIAVNKLIIDFNPIYTYPLAYYGEMIQFFAMPGTSGKVRLKVANAGLSDGTMIRRKTSPWASGDTKDTGTLVVNITDDSAYSGNNEWLEASGLSNGTTYYFKAFPYKGATYNQTIGVNECSSRAGLMLHEYTCDNISGNIIVDTAGSNNATSSNITFNSGKVGNSAQGYGSGVGVLNSSINMSQKAVSFWVYHSGSGSCACLGCTSNQSPQIYIIGNILYVGAWNPIFSELFYGKKASLTAGWNHIVVNFGTSSVYVYVNTVGVGSGSLTLSTSNINRLYYSFRSSGHNCDAKYYLKGKVDQLRFYSIALNGSEINTLYNNGVGC